MRRPKHGTATVLDMTGTGCTILGFLAIPCAFRFAFTSAKRYHEVLRVLTTWCTPGLRWHPSMVLSIARCRRLECLNLRCPSSAWYASEAPVVVDWSHVRRCSRLTHLDLSYCHLGVEGAGNLARALGCLRSLRTVGLEHNNIRDEGATAIAEALVSCTTLRCVSLRQNRIGDAGIIAVCTLLQHTPGCTELDLGGNRSGPEGVAALASAVGRLGALSVLALMTCVASDRLFRELRHCALRSLDLTEVTVGATEMIVLCSQFPHFPQLTTLDVSFAEIGDPGVTSLFAGLSKSKVVTLVLADNNLSGSSATLFSRLGRCSSLTNLGLNSMYVGSAGCTSLATVLHHLPTLRVLDLSNNHIGYAGLVPLAAALGHCRWLASLDLGGNPLGAEDDEDERPSMPLLCSGRHRCPSLTSLALGSTNLGDGGVTSLAMVLPLWPLLSSLQLSDNLFGDEGARVLAFASLQCPSLMKLDIGGCRIAEPGLANLQYTQSNSLIIHGAHRSQQR
jgi:Ran GTPase-activating protein (RanGAP) involved in mRNA processing and transport